MKYWAAALIGLSVLVANQASAKEWVVYEGQAGPGKGKHIVFLTGDEEYRSEEGLTQLAKILAVRHGFKCTVLYSINRNDGTIDPNTPDNIPGMEALTTADMMVMLLRFRELPDNQMKYFVDYVNSGKPILGLRTSTHAFAYNKNKNSPYAKYDWRSRDWPGGFGQQVLGDTWIDHHGSHGRESTRGIINEEYKNHPILRGVEDIWVPTDVYKVIHIPKDAQVLVYGQVVAGMKPTDPPLAGPKNNPMMPIVWLRNYTGETGKTDKIITTTMGASVDLENEGLRRLLVNACYWALGLDDQIPARGCNVEVVGNYKPTYFGGNRFIKGVKPDDLELK